MDILALGHKLLDASDTDTIGPIQAAVVAGDERFAVKLTFSRRDPDPGTAREVGDNGYPLAPGPAGFGVLRPR